MNRCGQYVNFKRLLFTEAICTFVAGQPENPATLLLQLNFHMVFSGDSSSITFLLAASSKTSQPIGKGA